MRPIRLFALVALLLVSSGALHALEVPPPPTRWFTDRAGIVSTTEASLLDTKLENFEQQRGAQFLIYIFPSLEGEAIEDFTMRAVQRWKVGQKKYDNGLVLFVFVQEKKVRVEVGYGLEGSVTDAFSSRVIREQIGPAFQRGEYGAGLNAAADAIIKKITTGEEAVPPLQPRGAQPQGSAQGGSDINPITLIFIIIVVFFFIVPMLTRRGRRGGGGGCNGCILPLFFMPGGGGGVTFGGGGGFGGGGFGGGGGGFSGGGGGFGGGGATGGW